MVRVPVEPIAFGPFCLDARGRHRQSQARAYQDFLALWKDADKDAPYLIQATKALAALL